MLRPGDAPLHNFSVVGEMEGEFATRGSLWRFDWSQLVLQGEHLRTSH